MNRRRLFGFLGATAGLAAASQMAQPVAASPEGSVSLASAGTVHTAGPGLVLGTTEDGRLTVNGDRVVTEGSILPTPFAPPESFVRVRQWEPRLGIPAWNLAPGTKFNDTDIRRDHTCQCFTCAPDIIPPAIKADRDQQSGLQQYDTVWDVFQHAGHFSPLFGRPSIRDFENGVRLKVWINGIPFSHAAGGLTEVITGENGRVWSFTQTPSGRHVCQTCLYNACMTVYRGRVEVDVMVPQGYVPDAPLRATMTG